MFSKFHGSEHLGKEESRGEKSNVNYALGKWAYFNYHDVIRCDSCSEKGTAIGYCTACSCFIDQFCLGLHQKILKWRTHKYFIFESGMNNLQITDFAPESVCQFKKHDNVVADAYCRKCKVVACSECIKRHRRNCKTINSLHEWYHFLQAVIKTKHIVENLLMRTPRSRNAEMLTVLSTIVIWLDQTLGIDSNTTPHSPIKKRLERTASTENQSYYIACNTIVDKFCEIQQELQREFHRSLGVLDGVQNTTYPKQPSYSYQIDDHIEEDIVSSLSEESRSSDEQSNRERGLSRRTNQMQMNVMYPLGNMDQQRFQQVTDDMGDDSMEKNVTIEKDIKFSTRRD
ncbi:unnamed protein product [Mytilus edulis]|uniref:B box-type domain-containing protein n=1 Tax=Mytilus edulis TaxID=6550 RepID=A0A8S3ULR3_MYTED|nr:unnamed protein product [Mytilus edulis]